MGRPSDYTEGLADVICARIADGESLRRICADDDMPARSTVFKWLREQTGFSDQYAHARDAQADALFEDMLEIADNSQHDSKMVGREGEEYEVCNSEFVQRARLRVDTRKWMAARLAPKKYGDKLQVGGDEDGAPIKHEFTWLPGGS